MILLTLGKSICFWWNILHRKHIWTWWMPSFHHLFVHWFFNCLNFYLLWAAQSCLGETIGHTNWNYFLLSYEKLRDPTKFLVWYKNWRTREGILKLDTDFWVMIFNFALRLWWGISLKCFLKVELYDVLLDHTIRLFYGLF